MSEPLPQPAQDPAPALDPAPTPVPTPASPPAPAPVVPEPSPKVSRREIARLEAEFKKEVDGLKSSNGSNIEALQKRLDEENAKEKAKLEKKIADLEAKIASEKTAPSRRVVLADRAEALRRDLRARSQFVDDDTDDNKGPALVTWD